MFVRVQSKKMEKLLAALNLPQVGEIRLVDPDDESYEEENDGSLFTIELNDRVYTMKVGNPFAFTAAVVASALRSWRVLAVIYR